MSDHRELKQVGSDHIKESRSSDGLAEPANGCQNNFAHPTAAGVGSEPPNSLPKADIFHSFPHLEEFQQWILHEARNEVRYEADMHSFQRLGLAANKAAAVGAMKLGLECLMYIDGSRNCPAAEYVANNPDIFPSLKELAAFQATTWDACDAYHLAGEATLAVMRAFPANSATLSAPLQLNQAQFVPIFQQAHANLASGAQSSAAAAASQLLPRTTLARFNPYIKSILEWIKSTKNQNPLDSKDFKSLGHSNDVILQLHKVGHSLLEGGLNHILNIHKRDKSTTVAWPLNSKFLRAMWMFTKWCSNADPSLVAVLNVLFHKFGINAGPAPSRAH